MTNAIVPRITSYNVCYTKLLRFRHCQPRRFPVKLHMVRAHDAVAASRRQNRHTVAFGRFQCGKGFGGITEFLVIKYALNPELPECSYNFV